MSCYKYWGKIEEIADKLSNFGNLDDDMDALDDVAIDEVIKILDEVEVIAHDKTIDFDSAKKFTGVPVGTKIIVTEAAKANYKGSAAVVINNEDKVAVVATKFNEEIKVLDEAANTGYKLGQNKNTVDVTNRYNNVPTTGIIMNTLPYVLMVALCAAALFGFVAFKRKKVQK